VEARAHNLKRERKCQEMKTRPTLKRGLGGGRHGFLVKESSTQKEEVNVQCREVTCIGISQAKEGLQREPDRLSTYKGLQKEADRKNNVL
jgi:hypothetical protein